MNKLDNAFIYTHDLDWYATDGQKIAHLTTGGTDTLPLSIIHNPKDWQEASHYIEQIQPYHAFDICHENLPNFHNEQEQQRYLESFIRMARKGFYSYDIDFKTKNCKLIAYPKSSDKALNIEHDIFGKLPYLKLTKIIQKSDIIAAQPLAY